MSTHEETQKIRALRAATPHKDDPRWEQLALGKLSDEERALLEADTSDEGRLLRELHRPLTPEEQERILAGAEERLDRPSSAEAKGDARAVAPVVQLRPRRKAIFGGVLVAAAAIVLFYLRGQAPPIEVRFSQPLGAEDPAEHLIAPDALFTATIVPSGHVDGTLQVRGAALVRDGRAIAWDPHPNPTSPENRIRIVGTRNELFPCLRKGEWTVVVAVGLPGPSLSVAEVQHLADQRSAGALHAVKKRIWLGSPVDSDGSPCRGTIR